MWRRRQQMMEGQAILLGAAIIVLLTVLLVSAARAQSILVPRAFKSVAHGVYLAYGAAPMHDVTVEGVRFCFYSHDHDENKAIYVSQYSAPREFFTMDRATGQFIEDALVELTESGGIEAARRKCK